MVARTLIPILFLILVLGCGSRSVAPLKVLGAWHKVNSGDTVDSVAKRYGAESETIAELNDLPLKGEITGRDEIFIPKAGGKPPGTGASPPPPITTASASGDSSSTGSTGSTVKAGSTGSTGSPTGSPVKVSGKCGVDGRPCFAWPVDGKLSARFGTRNGKHNDGIDISAPRGTAVKAADKGKVIYSGDAIKGYGNLVLLRHEGGIITVYAHNDRNVVAEGDDVKRGQKLAEVGSTGSATTVHLHFEVRVGEQPKDPLLYLPPVD